MLAAWSSMLAAIDTGPPRLDNVCGSASASTPRPASRAYTAPGPANARRSVVVPGIGVTGRVFANVAPSTRRRVPAVRSIAYAVAPCCTTSTACPASATCTCAATSTEEPSSSVTAPTRADDSHAAPDSRWGRVAGYPPREPKKPTATTMTTTTVVATVDRIHDRCRRSWPCRPRDIDPPWYPQTGAPARYVGVPCHTTDPA